MSPIRIAFWTLICTVYSCVGSRRFWRDFNQEVNEVIEKAKRAVEAKKEITYEEWFKHNNNNVNWSFMTLYSFFKNDSEALDLLDVLLRKLNAQNIHPELWSVQQKDGKFCPLIKWARGQNK